MTPPRAVAGFSLVEVLLLIAVVALLLGVALPNQLRAARQADTHHCRANLVEIQHALGQWSAANPSAGGKVTLEMLQPYFRRKGIRCPDGGEYSFTTAGQPPGCSVEGHGLRGQ